MLSKQARLDEIDVVPFLWGVLVVAGVLVGGAASVTGEPVADVDADR